MYPYKAVLFKCNSCHTSSVSLSQFLCFSIKRLLRKEFIRLSCGGNNCGLKENCLISQTLFPCNKRNVLLGCHYSLQFHFHTLCHKLLSKNQQEWENLLLSEKKDNIEAIPVKKENIYTIPNLLSFMRIGISPYIGYLIVSQEFTTALIFSLVAALSDVADGHIARRWPSQQSALGSAIDPLADKILVSILALSLTYVSIIPAPLTALFVSRDVLLIGAVFYLRYRTCPPPVTLKRYFDPTLVNAKLAPTAISKANTAIQLAVVWLSVASPVFGFTDHTLLKVLWGVSAITTIASGASYIQRKDTVRILKDDNNLKS